MSFVGAFVPAVRRLRDITEDADEDKRSSGQYITALHAFLHVTAVDRKSVLRYVMDVSSSEWKGQSGVFILRDKQQQFLNSLPAAYCTTAPGRAGTWRVGLSVRGTNRNVGVRGQTAMCLQHQQQVLGNKSCLLGL